MSAQVRADLREVRYAMEALRVQLAVLTADLETLRDAQRLAGLDTTALDEVLKVAQEVVGRQADGSNHG